VQADMVGILSQRATGLYKNKRSTVDGKETFELTLPSRPARFPLRPLQ
jgi:hypothetical protein